MYKDIQRIEDALLPALLEGIAWSHIRKEPSCKPYYEQMLTILKETIDKCFEGLTIDKRIRLYRRLDRIVNKTSRYFVRHKFDTRKAFLSLSEWITALLKANAIVIDPKSKYWGLLEDMGEIIQKNGYGEIENFEKIDASAIDHVPKLHKLVQQEGYFI